MAYTPDQLRTLTNNVIKSMTPPNKIEPAAHNGLLQEFINTFVALTGSSIAPGLATTSTNPGTPTSTIIYFCDGPGTYTYFDNITVTGEFAYFIWNGTGWDLYEVSLGSGYARKVIITTDIDTGSSEKVHGLGVDTIIHSVVMLDPLDSKYKPAFPNVEYITTNAIGYYTEDQLNTCKITVIG